MTTYYIIKKQAIESIEDPELRALVIKATTEQPALRATPTSPGGSRFERVKAERNRTVAATREAFIRKGFTREQVDRATEFLLEKRTSVKRDIEGRQARLKPFQKKQREEAIREAQARGEIVARTPEELERLKTISKEQRVKEAKRKLVLERAKKTISEQREVSERESILPTPSVEKVSEVGFPTGFVPERPEAKQETISLMPKRVAIPEKERTLFNTRATISAADAGVSAIDLKPIDFKFESREEIVKLAAAIPTDRVTRKERIETPLLFAEKERGGLGGFKATLALSPIFLKEGVEKLLEAKEDIVAFSILTAIAPPVAAAVGAYFVTTSIPPLVQEVRERGLIQTIVTEAPTLGAFVLGARAGIAVRPRVKAITFDIKAGEFTERITAKGKGFQRQDFVEVAGVKETQLTIGGKPISKAGQEFLLAKPGLGEAEFKPTPRGERAVKEVTRKELGDILTEMEKGGISKAETQKFDVFRPRETQKQVLSSAEPTTALKFATGLQSLRLPTTKTTQRALPGALKEAELKGLFVEKGELAKLEPTKFFHAGEVPPAAVLAKGERLFAFTERRLAEGRVIREGKGKVFEFESTDFGVDIFPRAERAKVFARPVPREGGGFRVITSQAPEFIIKSIASEKVVIGKKVGVPRGKIPGEEVLFLEPAELIRPAPLDVFGDVRTSRIPRPKIRVKERAEAIRRIRIRPSVSPFAITSVGVETGAVAGVGVGALPGVPTNLISQAQFGKPLEIPIIDTGVAAIPAVDVRQRVIQDTRQDQAVIPILDLDTTTPPRPPPDPFRPPPETPPPKKVPGEKVPVATIFGFTPPKPKIIKRKGYNVVVKKRDKGFVRVNEQPLPKNRAFNKGASVVDNTVSKSFKIVRGGDTQLDDVGVRPLQDKFRPRIGKTKLPKGTYVEKNAFAIDSFGEYMGITAKGIKARREQRRLF